MRPPERSEEPAAQTSPTDIPRTQAIRESLLSPVDGSRRQTNGHSAPMTLSADDLEDGKDVGVREAEILRLVNAGTPSHRSAWKKDSKAWQLFTNKAERTARDGSDTINEEEESTSNFDYASPDLYTTEDESAPEDGEQERYNNGWTPHEGLGIASSLPIPIGRPSFGQLAEQPKTSLTDRLGATVPALQPGSSTALRKAAYAERDRSRLIDPGALDFILDEDEGDQDEVDPGVGSTARQRALKILEARDRLPADGMWRSLAS